MNSRWKQYFLYTCLIIIGGGFVFILVDKLRSANLRNADITNEQLLSAMDLSDTTMPDGTKHK